MEHLFPPVVAKMKRRLGTIDTQNLFRVKIGPDIHYLESLRASQLDGFTRQIPEFLASINAYCQVPEMRGFQK